MDVEPDIRVFDEMLRKQQRGILLSAVDLALMKKYRSNDLLYDVIADLTVKDKAMRLAAFHEEQRVAEQKEAEQQPAAASATNNAIWDLEDDIEAEQFSLDDKKQQLQYLEKKALEEKERAARFAKVGWNDHGNSKHLSKKEQQAMFDAGVLAAQQQLALDKFDASKGLEGLAEYIKANPKVKFDHERLREKLQQAHYDKHRKFMQQLNEEKAKLKEDYKAEEKKLNADFEAEKAEVKVKIEAERSKAYNQMLAKYEVLRTPTHSVVYNHKILLGLIHAENKRLSTVRTYYTAKQRNDAAADTARRSREIKDQERKYNVAVKKANDEHKFNAKELEKSYLDEDNKIVSKYVDTKKKLQDELVEDQQEALVKHDEELQKLIYNDLHRLEYDDGKETWDAKTQEERDALKEMTTEMPEILRTDELIDMRAINKVLATQQKIEADDKLHNIKPFTKEEHEQHANKVKNIALLKSRRKAYDKKIMGYLKLKWALKLKNHPQEYEHYLYKERITQHIIEDMYYDVSIWETFRHISNLDSWCESVWGHLKDHPEDKVIMVLEKQAGATKADIQYRTFGATSLAEVYANVIRFSQTVDGVIYGSDVTPEAGFEWNNGVYKLLRHKEVIIPRRKFSAEEALEAYNNLNILANKPEPFKLQAISGGFPSKKWAGTWLTNERKSHYASRNSRNNKVLGKLLCGIVVDVDRSDKPNDVDCVLNALRIGSGYNKIQAEKGKTRSQNSTIRQILSKKCSINVDGAIKLDNTLLMTELANFFDIHLSAWEVTTDTERSTTDENKVHKRPNYGDPTKPTVHLVFTETDTIHGHCHLYQPYSKKEYLENAELTFGKFDHKKEEIEDRVLIFDFETVSNPDAEDFLETYSVAWYQFNLNNPPTDFEKEFINVQYEIGVGGVCEDKLIAFIKGAGKNIRYTLVGFNSARFDNFFIAKAAARGHCLSGGFVANNEIKGLHIWQHTTLDLCKIATGSLKQLCKSYNTVPKKMDGFDHTIPQRAFNVGGVAGLLKWIEDNKALCEEYNKTDVLATASLFVKVHQSINVLTAIDFIKSNLGTAGSIAHARNINIWDAYANLHASDEIRSDSHHEKRMFDFHAEGQRTGYTEDLLKRMADYVIDRQTANRTIAPSAALTQAVDDFYRECIIGGRTQNFMNKMVKRMSKAFRMVDAASLYPTVMIGKNRDLLGPDGLPVFKSAYHYGWFPIGQSTPTLEYKEGKIGFYNVDVISQPSKKVIPFHEDTLNWSYELGFNANVTSVEIECCRAHGGVINVNDGYYFEYSTDQMFMEFVTWLSAEKNRQDGYKKTGEVDENGVPKYNAALRETVKLLLNSGSGKMAQRNFDDVVKVFYDDYTKKNAVASMDPDQPIIFQQLTADCGFVSGKKPADKVYGANAKPSHIAALIYAYARLYMYEIIISRYDIHYMDTDSALLPLEDYNQFRADFPELDPNSKVIPSRPKDLGDFEEELECDDFKDIKSPYIKEERALIEKCSSYEKELYFLREEFKKIRACRITTSESRTRSVELELLFNTAKSQIDVVSDRIETLELILGVLDRGYVCDIYIMGPKMYYVEPIWNDCELYLPVLEKDIADLTLIENRNKKQQEKLARLSSKLAKYQPSQTEKIKSKIKGINMGRDKLIARDVEVTVMDCTSRDMFEMFNSPNTKVSPLNLGVTEDDQLIPNTKDLFDQLIEHRNVRLLCGQLKRNAKGVSMKQHYLVKTLTIKDFLENDIQTEE